MVAWQGRAMVSTIWPVRPLIGLIIPGAGPLPGEAWPLVFKGPTFKKLANGWRRKEEHSLLATEILDHADRPSGFASRLFFLLHGIVLPACSNPNGWAKLHISPWKTTLAPRPEESKDRTYFSSTLSRVSLKVKICLTIWGPQLHSLSTPIIAGEAPERSWTTSIWISL